MSFSVHTFEVSPSGKTAGFAFHETISEGQELYFLAKFDPGIKDADKIAETVFGAIYESLKSSKIEDSYDKFEDALKAANLEASPHAKHLRKASVVVGFFDFHHLYLSQTGPAEAYLLRGSSVSQISETPEEGDDIFVNILSGQVSVDDVVLFSSSRLLRAVTANELAEVFSRSDFADSVSLFRHKLTTAAEEDIVVTAVGIGKKEAVDSAGFLSKVVTKSKKMMRKAQKHQEHVAEAVEAEGPPETPAQEPEVEDAIGTKKTKTGTSFWYTVKNLPQKIASPASGNGNKKKLILAAGGILAIFIVAVFVRFIVNFESEETLRLREELSIAREALQQADTLLLQGERGGASEYLQTAQQSVQEVLSSKSKNFRSDAQFLLADIQAKQLQVENAKKVQPVLLADLGVKNDNLEAVGLIKLQEKLFAYDLKNVYKTVRNVVEKGIPLSSQETILAGAARDDQNTLAFLTDSPRMFEYREGAITAMNTEDETWKRGLDLRTYGQFVYILDPVENQVWKYKRQRSNYSGATPYNQGADLSRAISMAIDGSIYILSDDGTIQKLFRGVLADYEFRELPSIPFEGQNLKIYTSQELDFLYVLDPDNSRVLVFVKGERFATYKKQVLFDVDDARDFVVDDSGQKVNIITEDKIYEFSL